MANNSGEQKYYEMKDGTIGLKPYEITESIDRRLTIQKVMTDMLLDDPRLMSEGEAAAREKIQALVSNRALIDSLTVASTHEERGRLYKFWRAGNKMEMEEKVRVAIIEWLNKNNRTDVQARAS